MPVSTFFTLDSTDTINHYDYFLVAKGAEDRAYALTKYWPGKVSCDNLIIFDSRRKRDILSADDSLKYNSFDKWLEDSSLEDYQIFSAENTKLGALLASKNVQHLSKVAVDISSMNFWEISDLLYYIIRIADFDLLDIYYTEPNMYKYEADNITTYAHKEPQVSFNYPTNYMSTKTTQQDEIFVAIIGFQKNVFKLMRDLYEVSDWYSINGFPSFYPKAKDISLVNNADYIAEVNASNRFSAEATNPFLCINALSQISKKSNRAYMTICPLGSKPLSLGACLYTMMFQENTRLVYPYNEFVSTATEGVGKTYCYRIEKEMIP